MLGGGGALVLGTLRGRHLLVLTNLRLALRGLCVGVRGSGGGGMAMCCGL